MSSSETFPLTEGVHPKSKPRAFRMSGMRRKEELGFLTEIVIRVADTGLVYWSSSLMGYETGSAILQV
jgi:hypothetical protein